MILQHLDLVFFFNQRVFDQASDLPLAFGQ